MVVPKVHALYCLPLTLSVLIYPDISGQFSSTPLLSLGIMSIYNDVIHLGKVKSLRNQDIA